jgi:serine/threonine protein phosphatase PrpC
MRTLDTQLGQFGLIDGQLQNTSPFISIHEPDAPLATEARKGRLYLLTEVEQAVPRSEQLCQTAARSISRTFYDDTSYSITAALRAALRAANKALYEQNVHLRAHQRSGVGVTCAVLKGNDLFLAQVQPAQAYIISNGRLRAIPANPAWDTAHVSVAPFTRNGALGTSLFIEPEFYRATLHANDSALFCSSHLAQVLSRAEVEHAIGMRNPEATLEQIYAITQAQQLTDLHALALLVHAPQAQQNINGEDKQPGRPGRFASLSRPFGRKPNQKAITPPRNPEPSAPDPLKTMPDLPSHSPKPPSQPAPINVGESLGDYYEQLHAQATAHNRATPGLPPSSLLGEQPHPPTEGNSPPIDLGDGPALNASARPYRPRYERRPLVDLSWDEKLLWPFRRIGIFFEDTLANRQARRPSKQQYVRGQGLSYRKQRPPFPWAIFFTLAVVVTILIAYGLSLTEQNTRNVALEYLSTAEQRLADVREANDEAIATDRLELAREAIEAVQSSSIITSTNPTLWLRYQELQREYERALARVQRLTFFEEPTLLTTHPFPNGRFTEIVVPTPATTITDTALLDSINYLYALGADQANAQLYRIPREGGDATPFFGPNRNVGATVVGPLRAALWRIDQVVTIDEAPNGFGYYFQVNGIWNYTKLGSSEIWRLRDRLDVEVYDGNLYVWGAQPGEVLKFRSGSYGDTPEFWLNPGGLGGQDISTIVDMAVDGSIYLLRPNGSVLVFSIGQLVSEIVPGEITPPISAITRFAVTGTPEDGSFFMIEPLNERIIQVDKSSGEVIQQIKIRAEHDIQLDELTAITIDATGARATLYLVNGNQIIRADLPAPPQPFNADDASVN